MESWISVEERLPENRTRVLVSFLTKRGKRYITIAEYIAPKSVLSEDFLHPDYSDFAEYDEENDCYWTPSGFYESQYEPDINFYLNEKVTHWMPLPEPPKEENLKKQAEEVNQV